MGFRFSSYITLFIYFYDYKIIKKRKINNKSIYRDFPNSYYLTVNCQEGNLNGAHAPMAAGSVEVQQAAAAGGRENSPRRKYRLFNRFIY